MRRYKGYRTELKGATLTYYEDSSLVAARTGLIVVDMVASVLSGNSVGVESQNFTSSNNSLAYQLSFTNAGQSIVRITTTFLGTEETTIADYRYRVLDNQLTYSDYH